MGTKALSDEQVRRRQVVADTRAALARGQSVDSFLVAREAGIAEWTTIVRGLMDQRDVNGPIEILPEILVRLQEATMAEARDAARAAAKAELAAMLKKGSPNER